MREIPSIITESLRNGTCLSLVLSRRAKGCRETLDKVTVRPVEIGAQTAWQFAIRSGPRETHENLDVDAALGRIATWLGAVFVDGHLFATDADVTVRAKPDGSFRIRTSPPTHVPTAAAHDRSKQHLIPDSSPVPFLIEIGVMTPAGQVRASMRKKFRQINRFLELVDDIVPSLPDGPLSIVDFGCGKSYLTFALEHLLHGIHGRNVRIVGLDRRADVIESCRAVAGKLGCAGLEFRVGDIAAHVPEGTVDLAVSLHACDTATDDALAQAVRWKSQVILAVPCCQHELAPRITGDVLSPLWEHGILKERFAALATDALRANALELLGYRTQVVEFIDLEHTAKNLLIRGVRRATPGPDRERLVTEYRNAKRFLGIERTHLDIALGPEFPGGVIDMQETPTETRPARPPAGPLTVLLELIGIAVVLGSGVLLWVIYEGGGPRPSATKTLPPTVHANVVAANAKSPVDPPTIEPISTLPVPVAEVERIDPFAIAEVEPVADAEAATRASRDGGELDLSETSWQDPFVAELWQGTGWSFAKETMSTDAKAPAAVMFRRTYRELMLDLQVAPVGMLGEFEVRLTAPATACDLRLTLAERGMVLTTSRDGTDRRSEELRRKDFDPETSATKPGRLRFAATGNRVLVYWNDRRLFSCDQPAGQSGRDLQLSFHAREHGVRILTLRIEGE